MNGLAHWYVARRFRFGSRRSLAAAAALLALFTFWVGMAAPAAAQARLERLHVSLWPEFDRPAMLVMLQATLPADTVFPATVSLPMPTVAGTPTAVAFRGPDGSLLIAQNRLEIAGDTARVVVTTPGPDVRVEYYVALDTGNPERSYRFHWPGGIAVGQMVYDVLCPWGAIDVEVQPAGTRKTLSDGRTEERRDLGSLDANGEISIDVRYTKPATGDTTGGTQTQPAAQATQGDRPTARFATSDESETDSRWLVLFVVATLTFLCGFALGRYRRRP